MEHRKPQQGTEVRRRHGSAERPSLRGQLLSAVSLCCGDEPAGAAAAVHRGAAAGPPNPGRAGTAHQPAGGSRLTRRPDACASGGTDGGGAAASLPAASAARPAGRRSPPHLAHAAHQGGGGSHSPYSAHRDTLVIELAASRLVSACVRACGQSPPTSLSRPLRLVSGQPAAVPSPRGGKVRCAHRGVLG